MSENQSPITSDYSSFVSKLFNRTGDPSKDFAHAILGIVTESHELRNATDEVNALEEVGDLAFFSEALDIAINEHKGKQKLDSEAVHDRLKVYMDQLLESTDEKVIAELSTKLLDAAKRWVGYGKEPADLRDVQVDAYCLVLLAEMNAGYDFEPVRVMKANMAKLLKRYPGGEFDAYRAVVRDVEAERVVLQAS